jgi:mannose-1-phosphate guanylyltransferase/mannose-6-phosphate isomerase
MAEHSIENSFTVMNNELYATTKNHNMSSPWGSSIVLSGTEDSQNRVMHYIIKPKHTIPKKSYKHRSNHIIVLKGTAKVIIGDDDIILGKNGHLFISNGIEYSISNSDNAILEFFELQNGIKNKDGKYDLSEFA